MKKRILSVFLTVAILPVFCIPVQAEETELKIVSCVSDGLVQGAGTDSANLFDGNEESVALIDTSKSDSVIVNLESVSDISRIKIAVKNFPAWKSIKEIKVHSGAESVRMQYENKQYGILWAESEVDFKQADKIEISVDTVTGKNTNVSAIAEIQLYGTGVAAENTEGIPRELIYEKDFTIKSKSQALGGWEYDLKRCFDKNSRTTGGLGNIVSGYIVYEFPYPADVTKLSFSSIVNNDWAVAKEINIKAYNENVVYRAKHTNPEPVLCGSFTLKNTDEQQTVELSGDGYKRITHLIVEFADAYISGTKAVWGGWREMEIHGLLHSDAKRTSEIIATQLKSNVEILCDMGIVDGEPTEEYMSKTPTRLDMVKAVLKLTGEYDKAAEYTGTYNFSDADSENYNILSYIYAYKCFGIVGDGEGRFMPDAPLTSRACYKMILSYLGYSGEKDYTWNNLHEFCYSLGIGDMIYVENMTNKDMCNAIYESFNVPMNGTDKYFVDILKEEGRIPDVAWAKISDKQDRVKPILDGTYQIPDTADRNGEFTFTYNEWEHEMTPAAFCYNAPFHYAGMYYGMLPEDDPRSKRQEFAYALERAGARALRFPGGTPAHQYLLEGEKYAIELYDKSVELQGWGGLYNPHDYNNAWYVDFYDYLDFCKEYNIEPVFQMNPSFFVDEQGVVRQAYPCLAVQATDAGLITEPKLYDHNRIDEAIAAFERNLDEIVARGYKIKYWELGNEDNYKNYSALPLSDPNNPLTRDFLEAIAGYARAIKARFPDAHIIVCAGFPYKELMAPEDFALLTAVTKHYPFGRWTIPPVNENDSAARLARMNEQNFVQNYSKEDLHADQAAGNLIIDDTETMAWRFEGWNPNTLQHTFAQALNTAHNWGELVFDSGFIGLNVMHDLESPWFGSVVYDVCMDVGSRYLRWNNNVSLTVHKDDIPDIYKFEDAYYFNPASRSFELLGRHVGGRVLTNSRTNVDRLISGYASVKDDEVMFTIVNRFNETIPVSINLSNITVSEQTAEAQVLQSNYLMAFLEAEYNILTKTINVKGNNEDDSGCAVEFEAMPQSVTHFSVKLDSIN